MKFFLAVAVLHRYHRKGDSTLVCLPVFYLRAFDMGHARSEAIEIVMGGLRDIGEDARFEADISLTETAPPGHAPNPGELLVFGTNPDHGTAGAKQLGHVHAVYYEHATEGNRQHEFAGAEVIELLPDGSIRVYHPDGESLWGDI